MTGYLVVCRDTHCDDTYELHWSLEAAIRSAQEHVMVSRLHYKLEQLELDSYDCAGLRDWHFSEGSPCGSFRVHVREIFVPPFDSGD